MGCLHYSSQKWSDQVTVSEHPKPVTMCCCCNDTGIRNCTHKSTGDPSLPCENIHLPWCRTLLSHQPKPSNLLLVRSSSSSMDSAQLLLCSSVTLCSTSSLCIVLWVTKLIWVACASETQKSDCKSNNKLTPGSDLISKNLIWLVFPPLPRISNIDEDTDWIYQLWLPKIWKDCSG